MSRERLTREEQAQLAFHGLIDGLGPVALSGMIKYADERMAERSIDGVYYNIPPEDDPEDDQSPFATTFHIERDHVSVVLGVGDIGHTLLRSELEVMIDERLRDEPPLEQHLPPSA